MDWDSVLPIIIGLMAVIGLPLAIRSRKKGGPEKAEELYQHLLGIGVKASKLDKDDGKEKSQKKQPLGHKSVGVIKLRDRNIDSIDVIGVAGQYGVRYYLDFRVMSSSLTGREDKNRKTRMVRKKSSSFGGKTTDIEWKGDDFLVRKLNLDYQLKDKLMQADLNVLKGGIEIFPEPKHGYTRLRTNHFLPTPGLFEAVNIIAKHVKSSQ